MLSLLQLKRNGVNEMSKRILKVMDSLKNPGKYSGKELRENANDAYAAYAAAVAAADSDDAADAAAAAAAADNAAYWLNKYFEISGESRTDYDKELNNLNKRSK